jgi:hypothetical protein
MRRERRRCVILFYPMTGRVRPFDETIVPINEATLAQNHNIVDAILDAEVSGPVMSPDEFKAWLDRQ